MSIKIFSRKEMRKALKGRRRKKQKTQMMRMKQKMTKMEKGLSEENLMKRYIYKDASKHISFGF